MSTINNKILFTLQEINNVKIFNIFGELKTEHEEELGLLLMKAIHSTEYRAVLNLNNVSVIDSGCLNLIKKAYCTSIRLKNPLIVMDAPEDYLPDIYNCERIDTRVRSLSKTSNIAV